MFDVHVCTYIRVQHTRVCTAYWPGGKAHKEAGVGTGLPPMAGGTGGQLSLCPVWSAVGVTRSQRGDGGWPQVWYL